MKLLLLLLALPMIGFGQNVNIPDANFKAYLVGNTAINTNGDNEIQVSEASVFNGSINLNATSNIYNLTGIQAFTALTTFICSTNQLTSLDVSQNTALTTLSCSFNQLTSLDVSQNTALTQLYCHQNQLTSLNVSQNTALTDFSCFNNQLTSLDVSQNTTLSKLNCFNNQLTSLDVSQNTALTQLRCNDNQLTSLDVSQNTALIQLNCFNNQLTSLDVRNGNNNNFFSFFAYGNPNLYCINVDDAGFSLSNWTGSYFVFDPQHYFSNNCNGTGSIQELNTTKELLKVTDLLGRETKATNQVLIHIYDDGTIEKKIVFE